MTEIKGFHPVKLICGVIFSKEEHLQKAEDRLIDLYGPADSRSRHFDFDLTDYYDSQMGKNLKRTFLSFLDLIPPERLSEIKVRSNALEEDIRREFRADIRIVNLDPGYITQAALIMATAKDFSHRVPLAQGIYAHLEFLFTKTGIRRLDWTYPDFLKEAYQTYFQGVRKTYLDQLRQGSRRP
ncbi:MAG: DUF4416 family protein [Candidatus Aminicenantes bacterium]|nr:DUF4416 family protein [Candidatus Aminicenantes bacterium]